MPRLTTERKQAIKDNEGIDEEKFYKWTIEISVNETWVADGFDFSEESTERRLEEMLGALLPYAHEWERKARVIKSPSEKAIRKAQGYKD